MKKEKDKLINNLFMFIFLIIFLSLIYIYPVSAQKFTLKVTEEHPFLIDSEWISAKELKVGDELTIDNGKKAKITNIEEVYLNNPVNVYNLEALPFNDFIVLGDMVVHNSNPYKYTLFETAWEELGLLRKELIYIDEIPSDLAYRIRTEYDLSLRKNYNSIEELNEAAVMFSKSMYDSLPFLGFDNIQKLLDKRVSQKFLFNEYLKLSKCTIPKLSELIRIKQLDCTGQCLAIRESLGGKESGWELYHDISINGKKRVHTFLAKEIEMNNKKYMIIIDPLEVYLYKGNSPEYICNEYIKQHRMVIEKESFLKRNYPMAEIK